MNASTNASRPSGPGSSPGESLQIVVLGYLVRAPIGGLAWHHLQYVAGLAQLGHDVYFLEDSDDYASCYDPARNAMGSDPTYGLCFASDAFERLDLRDRWAFYDAHQSKWHGPMATHALKLCVTADVLLNLSGVNPIRPWFMNIPVRVLVDTDPVFTQIRHLTESKAQDTAARHTAFFTFGRNIDEPNGGIPDDGWPWQGTQQPVVLDQWSATPGQPCGAFSTIMQWTSYRSLERDGVRYGMKSESFEPYMDLPSRSGEPFELAVGSPTAPRQRLRDNGWNVLDPLATTRDPWTYQRFIQQSKAEFSVAKHGYVVSRSGWFSERSLGYMASARPVLIQETGFSDWLPTGNGVLAFSTPDEALAGIEEINRRYQFHCDAARSIVHEYFDARTVLTSLIERAMNHSR